MTRFIIYTVELNMADGTNPHIMIACHGKDKIESLIDRNRGVLEMPKFIPGKPPTGRNVLNSFRIVGETPTIRLDESEYAILVQSADLIEEPEAEILARGQDEVAERQYVNETNAQRRALHSGDAII